MATGVYQFVNRENGHTYVGSAAKGLREREYRHRVDLNANRHRNRHFQSAWNKYGEAAFEFSVLELADPAECVGREQHWIDKYRAEGRTLYNLHLTAGSPLGWKHDEKTKAVMSAKAKARKPVYGRKRSPEACARISESQKGRKQSPEHIAKRTAGRKAFNATEAGAELRAKASARLREFWTGRKHSEAAKAKMSAAARTGKKQSDEFRAKISEIARARYQERPELAEQIRQRMLGTKHAAGKRSPEACERMRAAAKAAWERKKRAEGVPA